MAKSYRSLKWIELMAFSLSGKSLADVNAEVNQRLTDIQEDPAVRVDYIHVRPMQFEGFDYFYITIGGRRLVKEEAVSEKSEDESP